LFASKPLERRICKTRIFSVSCGSETQFLILREELRLQLFESKAFMKIFGPKKYEENEHVRIKHNSELHCLHGSPSKVRTGEVKETVQGWSVI
jgi:hypothetical protein